MKAAHIPAQPLFLHQRVWRWLVNDASIYDALTGAERQGIDGFRLAAFISFHLACLAVFHVGVSVFAVLFACVLYFARMFFITAFYHRYFSHRTYRVSRPLQFCMALAGCTAGQRGPVWWASHHRQHHLASDTQEDPHSPLNGFLDSHMLWFLRRRHFAIRDERVRDLLRFPELRLLEHVDWLPLLLLLVACYVLGEFLAVRHAGFNTDGPQLLIWGGLISTVLTWHATYSINSLAHLFGSQRFKTGDESRNNAWLALLTLGEGWHNNHHRYPQSTRQGFYPGEFDIAYYLLKILALTGLAKDFKSVPAQVIEEGRAG